MNQFDSTQFYIQMNEIGKDGERSRRAYHSASLAAFDFFYSVTRHLLHKNTIAILNHQSSLTRSLKDLAIKNDLIVVSKENQSSAAFIESINASEVVFLVWSDHHEITGEQLFTEAQINEIETALNKKRIYSLRITNKMSQAITSQLSYVYELLNPNLFNYHCKALLISPYKERIPFSIAEIQNVTSLGNQPAFQEELAPVSLDENLKKYDYFGHFRISDEQKPKDRVVLYMDRLAGSLLKEVLQLDDQSAFAPSNIPSWITDGWSEWWPESAKPKVLSGVLVLRSSLFSDSSFQDRLYQVIQKLEKETEWSY